MSDMSTPCGSFHRRDLLRAAGTGLLGSSFASWLPALAARAAREPGQKRHCILLWMSGGPSQTDTFDMKPGHANGGEFKEAATRVPGLRFSEHLPKLAEHAESLAIVRSLSTKEGDHARGTHLVRTGHPPMADVAYPSIACSLAKQLATDTNPLPNYVSVAPPQEINPASFGPGFLGARFAPAIVAGSGDSANPQAPATVDPSAARLMELKLADLELPAGVDAMQSARRLELWNRLEEKFFANRSAESYKSHRDLYQKAAGMMREEVRAAFNLSEESEETRRKYGPGLFGQGCLLARRLVERGVPFVEVPLGTGLGWDTHADNFRLVRQLSIELDQGWATLMTELKERGLLDSTTILWISEFGRTPVINSNAGRDHFPNAWSCVFAGGGIQGGQAFGRTSDDGMSVEEGKVEIGDVLATLCAALGVPPDHEEITPMNRPVKLSEGTPISQLLT